MKFRILLIVTLSLFHEQFVCSQCTDIEKIQNYKATVRLTHSNLMYNDVIDTSTFNIKTYMAMYPSLKTGKKGYVFGCYYYDNFIDGSPYIYIRNKKFNLIRYINRKADKIKLKGEERADFVQRSLYYFLEDSCNRANKNIIPEDTEEGYIQYLYFCELGELFALKWHAIYNSKQVVCSKKGIEGIVKEYMERHRYSDSTREVDNNGEMLDPVFYCDTAALQNLLLLDTVFSIQFNTDNVIIKWLEVEETRGIYERSYKIMRTSPYHIGLIDEKRLVEIRDIYLW